MKALNDRFSYLCSEALVTVCAERDRFPDHRGDRKILVRVDQPDVFVNKVVKLESRQHGTQTTQIQISWDVVWAIVHLLRCYDPEGAMLAGPFLQQDEIAEHKVWKRAATAPARLEGMRVWP